MEYPIVIEQDPEAGGYVVFCPTIKTYLHSIEDLKRLNKLRTVEVSV